MRTKKSIINVLVGTISLIFTTILGFVNSRYFALNIGVETSGLNSVFTNVIAIMSVTELGIAGAINYNLYKPVHEKDYEKVSQIMSFYKKCYMIIGTVILLVSLIVSNYIYFFIEDTTFDKNYIQFTFILCSLSTVLSYFLAYHRNLFYAFQDNYITLIIDSAIRVITLFIQLFVLIYIKSYIVYLIVNLLSNIASNMMIAVLSRKKYKEITFKSRNKDKNLEKKVLSDVKSLAVIQITSALINFTDAIIISRILGVIIAGIYSFYAQIINILTSLINMIFNSLGASIGNLLAEDEREKIKNVLHILIYICFFIGIFIASGIINGFQPLIIFWLGEDFLIDYSIIFVLGVNFYILVQRQVISYYLRTGGYHDRLVVPLVVEAVINLIVSIALANKFGLLGVFIGTMVSALFGIIQNSYVLHKIYCFQYSQYIKKELFWFILFVLETLVTHYFLDFVRFKFSSFVNFLFTGILSIVLPTIIILVIAVRNKTIKEFIYNHLKKRR